MSHDLARRIQKAAEPTKKWTESEWIAAGKLVSDEDGLIVPSKAIGIACQRNTMAEMLLSMFVHVSHGGPTREEAEALLKKAGVL